MHVIMRIQNNYEHQQRLDPPRPVPDIPRHQIRSQALTTSRVHQRKNHVQNKTHQKNRQLETKERQRTKPDCLQFS